MAQADSDRLVQYIFPTERLPAHTQELLKEPQGLGRRVLDSWPQYRGRIRQDAAGRPQVFLNVFEYFMFWTAFYVLRGSSSDSGRADPRAPSGSASASMMAGTMSGFRSMGSAIVGGLLMGRPTGTLQSHPYYRLLRTYLDAFLPRSGGGGGGADGAAGPRASPAGAAVASPGAVGGGMGLGPYGLNLGSGGAAGSGGGSAYKPGTLTAAAGGPDSRGSVVLSVLVEFWLTDLTEPLPVLAADRVSGGVVTPGGVGGAAGMAAGMGVGGGMSGVGVASPGGLGGLLGGPASPNPVTVTVATPPNVRMLTFQPPSEELVEGLVALVRYVHVAEPMEGVAYGSGSAAAGGAGSSRGGGAPGSAGRLPGGGSAAHGGRAGSSRAPPAGSLTPAQVGRPPWLPETPVKTPPPPPPRLLVPPTALVLAGNSAGAAVQAVSRKVYRQLRRAFSQWPAGSPASLTPLITLWLSVIAPWCPTYAHTRKTSASDAAAGGNGSGSGAAGGNGGSGGSGSGAGGAAGGHHLPGLDAAAAAAAGVMEATAAKLHLGGGGGGGGRERERELAGAVSRELLSQYPYTPAWRSHVLAHLPFYSLLLPQFVSLSLSRLKYRPDVALRDLDRVLAVMAAAGPELLRELRGAEAALNDYGRPAAAGGRRRSEGELGEALPWWFEQAQDFEAAAAAGSSQPGSGPPDVTGRLFACDISGAAYSACLLLRSAETLGRPELVAALRQSAGAVLPLGSILPASVTDQPRGPAEGEGCFPEGGRFPPPGRISSLVKAHPQLADPHRLWLDLYKGDPLLRPIASNELAFLVRPLVRASVRINCLLGLDRPYAAGEEEADPPEHLGQAALLWARRRKIRVNLRIFAEVQTLAWLAGLVLLAWALVCVFGGGGGGGAPGLQAAGGGGGGHVHHAGGAYQQQQQQYQQHQQYQYQQQQYRQYQGQGQRQYQQRYQGQGYQGGGGRAAGGGEAPPAAADGAGGYRFAE
ncbi:hypothetical protein HYH03_000372 [Edaphochlamys debaryana]|uniref:Uncharacterized protein n=1 Tax=Edaphochlamys debaryana TaxID=47281 RepID=A0A835YQ94_9CHLO|nr:hypothetical protein HYH03_000372 [Edaphochlamys debaryana]|eukprot:KAG2501874.1 hypothetical protein HYH03_000372 [Edaphochlamys debaryana]